MATSRDGDVVQVLDERPMIVVPPDPLAFIAQAVARGANPDELDKLLTLHERVTATQARVAYAEAMRRCQERMPTILKTHKNSQTHSSYPKFENLLQLIKPIYVAEGFALSFGTDGSILPGHYRIICDVKHVGGHAEQYFGDFPSDGIGAKGNATAMNAVQGVGSTYTYSRRYLTAMIFNLTIAGEDTDAAREQTASEEELRKRDGQLDKIRDGYVEAHLTEEEEAKFWAWVGVEPGSFSDIAPAKYRDIFTNLKKKAAVKAKAVTP